MQGGIRQLSRFLDGLALLSGILIVVMSLFSSFEVVMRYMLNAPTKWSMEVSQTLMLIAAFLAAGSGLMHGAHVTVDVIYDKASAHWKRILTYIGSAAGLIYCGVLISTTSKLFVQAYTLNFRTYGNLALRMDFLYGIIIVGSVFFFVAFLAAPFADPQSRARAESSDVEMGKGA